jgi:hypothetical protein
MTELKSNPAEEMLEFFKFDHLPPHLLAVSAQSWDLACKMVAMLPSCSETTAGMRKLLEAKDCFVRAQLSQSK